MWNQLVIAPSLTAVHDTLWGCSFLSLSGNICNLKTCSVLVGIVYERVSRCSCVTVGLPKGYIQLHSRTAVLHKHFIMFEVFTSFAVNCFSTDAAYGRVVSSLLKVQMEFTTCSVASRTTGLKSVRAVHQCDAEHSFRHSSPRYLQSVGCITGVISTSSLILIQRRFQMENVSFVELVAT